MKRSKAYRAAAEKVNLDQLYSPEEALALVASGASAKFDETVDVAIRLGVDPKKADQMVRGTVNLPHGTGKTARVLVFATGEKAEAAREAGADEVGDDDLIAKVQGGYLDFDSVVATPDMMGKVGRLGRVLGPRGLMPNPKTGTVTMDVAKAVSDIKGGKIEFRTDRYANLHFLIGRCPSGRRSWPRITSLLSTRSCVLSRTPLRVVTCVKLPFLRRWVPVCRSILSPLATQTD